MNSRTTVVPAVLAAGLLLSAAPPARAADDSAHADDAAQTLTAAHGQHVASHAAGIARALGQTRGPGDRDAGRAHAPPKAHRKLVLTVHPPLKLDARSAPPVLSDIANAPSLWQRALALVPGAKIVGVVAWLTAQPDNDDLKRIGAAYDYYHAHTKAGAALGPEMRPLVGDLPPNGGAAFADTGKALAVTVPLPPQARSQHDERWRVIFNSAERQAPIEAMTILMGHEIGVHASDVESGFLGNPGSQIPSELRAMVLDAKNYLELRAELENENPQRLLQLRGDDVWQQADLKARILIGAKVEPSDYITDLSENAPLPQVFNDANEMKDKQANGLKPVEMARAYISRKYKDSGETGLENLNVADDSPVGLYNKDTDRLIGELRLSDYPFMKNGF